MQKEAPKLFSYTLQPYFKVWFTIRRFSGNAKRTIIWACSRFPTPAPNFVKWAVLRRYGGKSTWVETGTYLGETTNFISKFASLVISIEPSKLLAARATKKFSSSTHVVIENGTSETSLDKILEKLTESQILDISFWLDGHYSAGVTFLAEKECPVIDELDTIQKHISRFQNLTIFIDDVRVFSPSGQVINGYPSLSYLVSWADLNKLKWNIEHDIFIMTNR